MGCRVPGRPAHVGGLGDRRAWARAVHDRAHGGEMGRRVMKHTARTIVLLAVAGAVVAAAAFAATGHHRKHHRHHVARDAGRLGPALFGFNDNSVLMTQAEPVTAVQRSAAAGANVVRYTVNWDYVEAQQGQWNWHGYDPLYAAAIDRGIRPILVAGFSPGWARPLDLSCGAADRAHCKNPPATRFDSAWTNFLTTLVERYPQAAAIEVWNEPNLSNFWEQGPDPERYAHLLNLAYDAIKHAAPSMRVLGGALSNTKYGGGGSKPYEPYINKLLGLKPKFDALAVHDYDIGAPDDPNWFAKTLDIARSALDAN